MRLKMAGYEWGITCECGQTINLSGMSNNPIPDEYDEDFYQSELVSERVRRVDGMREAECPNKECNRTLRFGVEVVE